MTYLPYQVSLTGRQKELLAAAIQARAAVTLRLTHEQLENGSDILGLTQMQINRIEKRKAARKGVQITLSSTQIAKQGGFIGPLLASIAKTVLPQVGIAALQSAASTLVNKAISGSGCNCGVYAKKAAPHLLKELSLEQQKRAMAEMKEGGFLLPLIAAAASSIIPSVVDLIRGKGYQVKPPPNGSGYQVKPPKGSGYQVKPPPKNYFPTL